MADSQDSVVFQPSLVEKHLPQSSIQDILQDQYGYIWFATREGLSRWDGARMRTWRTGSAKGPALPGMNVNFILEDRSNNIWVRTRPWDRQDSSISRLVGPDHLRIESYNLSSGAIVFVDAQGEAYFGSHTGVQRYDQLSGQVIPVIDLPISFGQSLQSGVMVSDGTVYLSNATGQVFTAQPGDESWREITVSGLLSASLEAAGNTRLFEDSNQQLWLSGAGLAYLSEDKEHFISINHPDLPNNLENTTDIIEDTDGSLLVATMQGVTRVDPLSKQVVERWPLSLVGVRSDQQWVLTVLRDSSGGLWAGSLWGLQYFHPKLHYFRLLQPSDEQGKRVAGTVSSILARDDGSLWVASFGGGHYRLDTKTGLSTRIFGEELQNTWIWSLAENSRGDLFAASEGLYKIAAGEPGDAVNEVFEKGELRENLLLTLHITDNDELWFVSPKFIGRVTAPGETDIYQIGDKGEASSLFVDGSVRWLGTTYGLIKFFEGQAPEDGFQMSDKIVTTLAKSSDGTLWVGTTRGLFRYDAVSNQLVAVPETSELQSTMVNCVVEDLSGQIWFSTSRSLVRYNQQLDGAQRVRVFGSTQGIGNDEFNRNACTRGPDGRLYFGGNRGVTEFDPSQFSPAGFQTPLMVTAVNRTTAGGTSRQQISSLQEVTILPEEYSFGFDLAALSLPSSENAKYSVWLEGLDSNWIDIAQQNSVTYTNIPPGEYVFRARTQSADGVWSKNQVAVAVVVQPYFWETLWFQILAAFVLLAFPVTVLWLVFRRRYDRRLGQLQSLEVLEKERLRISQDMHDEIGTGLTEIAILSELAKQKDGDSDRINKIADRSRSLLDAIGEIIWAMDPHNDSSKTFFAYLREYAAEFLEAANIEAKLDFPDKAVLEVVPTVFRRNIFLVLKESLANVAKHAQASRVYVSVYEKDEVIRLLVKDNGDGFKDNAEKKAGHGLRNLHARAKAIGGKLRVSSGKSGTSIDLQVPHPGRIPPSGDGVDR